MDAAQTNSEKYAAAKAHVAAIKGFYIHLTVFLAVMVGLAIINAVTGERWWVQWPLIGWGIGLIGHAYFVFHRPAAASGDWERRKIEKTMAKM